MVRKRATKGAALDASEALEATQAPVVLPTTIPDTGLPTEDVSTELAVQDAELSVEGAFGNDAEKDQIQFERDLIEKRITAQFNPEFVKILKRIAYYLSKVGLSLKETLQLVQVNETDFDVKRRLYPVISELISLKELEYKADLLATISSKARTGNDKLGTWLLQSRYPDEYNKRKGNGEGGGDDEGDLVAMGVEFVQKHGDSSPMVTERSGRAFVITKNGSGATRDIRAEIQKMLG